MNADFAAVVLAAGQGTRMKSSLPKVLHSVLGVPMYAHVVKSLLDAAVDRVVVVVGHGREAVRADVASRFDGRVTCAVQEQQLGTGHAAKMGLDQLPSDFSGWVLVLCGDTPLVHAGLVRALAKAASESTAPLVMVTATVADPTGYGRILRDASGRIVGIREHNDASAAERASTR